ncbi:MAG: hypothetical protein HYX43_07845 [Burkholderiales bacterium]|nr:hypothetical protein [Burkholderiales bacterium]
MTPLNIRVFGAWGLAPALLLCALSAAAQDSRDPTVAPPESAAVGASPMGVEGMTVLVRDGKPYLVVGTRLYAVGDKVGAMRVDRITESEVWLHDGRAPTRVPRFTGIERRTVATKSACATAASAPAKTRKIARRVPSKPQAPAPNSPPANAPCEDTQP